MKKYTWFCLLAILSSVLLFFACKKDTDPLDAGTDLKQMTSDETMHSSEMELLLDDVNTVIFNSGLGKTISIPGATVNDSDFMGQKSIVINYDKTTIDGRRIRDGSVNISLTSGEKWSDIDAVLHLTLNVKVLIVSTTRLIQYKGDFEITNVTGGKVFVHPLVIHTVVGSGSVNFENGQANVWNVNRKRTFQNSGGIKTVKTESDLVVDSVSNVTVWGVNRKGVPFYTIISQPVIFSSACPGKPISGVKIHTGLAVRDSVVYGVDTSGIPVTVGCPYGLKLTWKNKKDQPKSAIIEY